jgi:hypothetical protein
MPFYEIIYETGTKSVVYNDSEEEMLEGVKAQHQRALKGEPGGPTGHPAERVVKIEVYEKHPNEYNVEQVMSAEVMTKEVTELIKSKADAGSVSIPEIANAVRGLSHPMLDEAGPHESIFKMKSVKTIDKGWE